METKILCIDDEVSILKLLAKLLSRNGYPHVTVDNPIEAQRIFGSFHPDIVLMDIMMPGVSGNDLLDLFIAQNPRCKIIMITAHPSTENALHALQAGAFDFIIKPFKIEYLLNCIARAKKMILEQEETARLQGELEKNNVALQELISFKQDLLTRLIHDLRYPALSTLTLWRTLADIPADSLSENAQRTLQRGLVSLELFFKILDNLMEITLVETGRHDPLFVRVDVIELVQSVMEKLEKYRSLFGVNFHRDISIDKAVVAGDRARLVLVLENLLTNSLHYTAEGGRITVSISREEADDGPRIAIAICDTGVGISREDSQKIFQPYFRRKKASPHGVQGAGLGLFLVKNLVHMHHAKLKLSTREGKGSTFTILLKELVE